MLKAAQDIAEKYPEKVELRIAESVPFAEYIEMMNGSDAILDQLYSYTPSMNPLEAMARGIICIGGGEPETTRFCTRNICAPSSMYCPIMKVFTSSWNTSSRIPS